MSARKRGPGRPRTGRKATLTIRVDPDVMAQLQKAAKRHKQSISDEVRARLAASLEPVRSLKEAVGEQASFYRLDDVVGRLEAYEKHEMYAMRLLKTAEDVSRFWEARCKELQQRLEGQP